MPIPIECPQCKRKAMAPDAAAGKKIRCPGCQELFRAPTDSRAVVIDVTPGQEKPKAAPALAPVTTHVPAPAAYRPPRTVPVAMPPAPIVQPPPVPVPVVQPPVAVPVAYVQPAPAPTRTLCYFCGEEIQPTAKKCRHCGEFLDPALRQQQTAPAPTVVIHNNNTATASAVATVGGGRRWNRLVAVLLSFLFPGLGQMYKGQIFNGAAWMAITVLGYFLYIVPGVVLHLCCIAGAAMGDNRR